MNGLVDSARTAARIGVAKAMAGSAMRALSTGSVILAYHRVSPAAQAPPADEPGMYVSLQTFERQMDFLRQHLAPVAVGDIADAVGRGLAPPPGCFAVTFDDAWADSANALPALRRWGIPATMFASAANVGGQREFWTRRLLRILSSARNGRGQRLPSWPSHAAKAAMSRLGSKRLDGSRALTWLASLPSETREDALDRLAETCGVAAHRASSELMSPEDLRAWLPGGMDVGSHGYDHGCLPASDRLAIEREVVESRRLLRDVLGVEVAGFAYPYGAVNEPARSAVVGAGYEYACALARPRKEPPDAYLLPRRPVHEGASAGLDGEFGEELFACYLAGAFDWRRR